MQNNTDDNTQSGEFLELLMGCACVHPDAHMCFDIRYNRSLEYFSDFDEACQCYCHSEWDDEDEDYDA